MYQELLCIKNYNVSKITMYHELLCINKKLYIKNYYVQYELRLSRPRNIKIFLYGSIILKIECNIYLVKISRFMCTNVLGISGRTVSRITTYQKITVYQELLCIKNALKHQELLCIKNYNVSRYTVY